MIHEQNQPHRTHSEALRGKLSSAAMVLALAGAMQAAAPTSVEAAPAPKVGEKRAKAIERLFERKLAKGEAVPTANGTATVTRKVTDPYTGEEIKTVTEIENPLVYPVKKGDKLPRTRREGKVNPKKVVFGSINLMQRTGADVNFSNAGITSVRFKRDAGRPTREVQFEDKNDNGRPDWGRPLNGNGARFPSGELFGIGLPPGNSLDATGNPDLIPFHNDDIVPVAIPPQE